MYVCVYGSNYARNVDVCWFNGILTSEPKTGLTPHI